MASNLSDEITLYKTLVIDGSNVSYLDVGQGANVLLIPGWSLSPRIYEQSARQLASNGFRVVVPEVYGLNSKKELALSDRLEGLVDHVGLFAKTVFEDESFNLVGHSLGGALSILSLALGRVDVEKLVLVNSIGDPSWVGRNAKASTMNERPINDWIGAFVMDFAKTRHKNKFVMRLASESLMEFMRNPSRVVQYAMIARSLDLRAEMELVAKSRTLVLAIWTTDDIVVPRESFESLALNLKAARVELNGTHAWIFTASVQFASLVGEFLKP